MNTDIRIDVTLPRHRKFLRLKRQVGPGAMEALVTFWLSVAAQEPTGLLCGWDEEDVDSAGECSGLCAAMLDAGFLDRTEEGFAVHNWEERQPWAAAAPNRVESARAAGQASARARAAKYGSAQPTRTTTEQPSNDSRTNRSDVRPNDSRTPSPSPSPSPKVKDIPTSLRSVGRTREKFIEPSREEVEAYARAERLGSMATVLAFHDHFTSNGWKVGGKAPMKDWQAAYRNWCRNEAKRNSNSKSSLLTVAMEVAHDLAGSSSTRDAHPLALPQHSFPAQGLAEGPAESVVGDAVLALP